jgi:flavoprotein
MQKINLLHHNFKCRNAHFSCPNKINPLRKTTQIQLFIAFGKGFCQNSFTHKIYDIKRDIRIRVCVIDVNNPRRWVWESRHS